MKKPLNFSKQPAGINSLMQGSTSRISQEFIWKLVFWISLICLSLPIASILTQVSPDIIYILGDVLTSDYTINTVILMILVGSISLILGIGTAWITARYQFFMSSFFSWALVLPLSIPSYIMAYTYKGVFGLFGTSHSLFNIYFDIENIYYLSIIMAISLFPYVYLTSRISFMLSSKRFIESSLSLGKPMYITFYRVVLPLSWPAIFGGLLLVLMEVLNNYGAVQYFGIKTFTTEIIRQWNPMNTSSVNGIAAVLILLGALFYLLEKWARKGAKFSDDRTSSHKQESKQVKGRTAFLLFFICTFVLAIGFLIPAIQLFAWTWGKWEQMFDSEMQNILGVTFAIGVSAAALLSAFVFLLKFTIHHGKKVKWLSRMSRIPSLGYSVPGALLGVGLLSVLYFVNTTFGISLTSSISILIFAYLVRFYSVSYGSINGGYQKISKNLGLASFSLGKDYTSTISGVHLKILGPVLLTSCILVFVDVIKELPLTMMFQQFNYQTLAVKAFKMMETDGAIYDAALPSLLIVLISLIPVYFVNRWIRK